MISACEGKGFFSMSQRSFEIASSFADVGSWITVKPCVTFSAMLSPYSSRKSLSDIKFSMFVASFHTFHNLGDLLPDGSRDDVLQLFGIKFK